MKLVSSANRIAQRFFLTTISQGCSVVYLCAFVVYVCACVVYVYVCMGVLGCAYMLRLCWDYFCSWECMGGIVCVKEGRVVFMVQ